MCAGYSHIICPQLTADLRAAFTADDVLSLAFMTFFQSDRPVLFPDITYSFYDVWADLYRIPYEKKALGSTAPDRGAESRRCT